MISLDKLPAHPIFVYVIPRLGSSCGPSGCLSSVFITDCSCGINTLVWNLSFVRLVEIVLDWHSVVLLHLRRNTKLGQSTPTRVLKILKLCTLTFEQGKCCQLDISASAIARTSLRLLLLLLQTPLGKRVNPVDKGARRGHGQVCPGQLSLLTSPLSSCWNWDNLS